MKKPNGFILTAYTKHWLTAWQMKVLPFEQLLCVIMPNMVWKKKSSIPQMCCCGGDIKPTIR
ncbi:hypothetical protein D3C80_2116760 [compost metagenome]